MPRFLYVACLAPLGLGACLEINPGGADAGTKTAGASGADAGAVDATTGSNCAHDSVSGVTLCTTTSLCPKIAIDHDVYPDCGFRVSGTILDLECVCGDYLCPVGTALTCDGAADLLATQSEQSVCTAISEGRCAARAPSTKPRSGCDMICASECGGSLACMQACGC